jgi:hypothetical protein
MPSVPQGRTKRRLSQLGVRLESFITLKATARPSPGSNEDRSQRDERRLEQEAQLHHPLLNPIARRMPICCRRSTTARAVMIPSLLVCVYGRIPVAAGSDIGSSPPACCGKVRIRTDKRRTRLLGAFAGRDRRYGTRLVRDVNRVPDGREPPEQDEVVAAPGPRDVGVPGNRRHLACGAFRRRLRSGHHDEQSRWRPFDCSVGSCRGTVRVPRHLGRRKVRLSSRTEGVTGLSLVAG